MQVVILDLPETLAGAYARRSTGPLIFLNGTHHVLRQRFTLAHELGHHWLDHPTTIDDLRMITGARRDPVEVQATLFAAELLAPRAAVRGWAAREVPGAVNLDDVVRLGAHFGVSGRAARIALERAGVLRDRGRVKALDGEIADGHHNERRRALGLAASDDSLVEAGAYLPRLPEALAGTLMGALVTGELTVAQAAACTGREVGEVEAALGALGLTELFGAPR